MFNLLKQGREYIDKDFELSIFICAYLIIDILNSTVQVTFGMSGSTLSTFKFIMQLILFILLICCIQRMPMQDFSKLILFEFLGLAICLYSILLGASASSVWGWGKDILMVYIPIFAATYLIKEKEVLYRALLKSSWIVLVIAVFNYVGSAELYDMHFSYCLLLLILLHLNEWVKSKKKIFLILSIIEFLMMLTHGSRGALVCVVVFIILKIITLSYDPKKKIALIATTLVVSLGGYFLIQSNSSAILALLRRIGLGGRTINLLFSGQFSTHDGGRYEIWAKTIELIKEKPWQGWGMTGCVKFLETVGDYGAGYPHQLFLDLFMSFGIPIGLILSIFIVTKLRFVLNKNLSQTRDLTQIMVSISFVSLMFTGTFFTNFYFYIMMGILMSFKRDMNFISLVETNPEI